MQIRTDLTTTLAAGFAATLLLATPAMADEIERRALLIGNGDYENAPDALTAERDVRAVAEALRQAGWQVTVVTDADRDAMHEALARFADQGADQGADQSKKADDILIYYSGHALRTDGRTLLAPTDQEAASLVDVLFGGVPLSLFLRIAEEAADQGVVLIDAAQLDGFEPTGFVEPGLAPITAPDEVVVLSAAPPGQALLRESDEESPFARMLTDDLMAPGAELMATAEDLGAPLWVAGQAEADFALAPETEDSAEALAREIELAYWRTAERTGRAEDYHVYLDRYPDGIFADFARSRLESLNDGSAQEEPGDESTNEAIKAARAAERALDLDRNRIRQVQNWLAALDFDPGSADGLIGANTRAALRDWERANDRDVNGYLDSADLNLLQMRGEAALAEARRATQARDDAYWAETGARETIEGYRAYLDRYPEGLHAEAARDALAGISETEADAALRRERRDWARAERADTAEALRDYLQEYPDGIWRSEALERLDEIEDTQRADHAREAEDNLDMNRQDRRSVEQRLRALGFGPGPIDGEFDSRTRAAIRAYQASRDMAATGYLDRETLVAIVQETSETGPAGQIIIDGTRVINQLMDIFGRSIDK